MVTSQKAHTPGRFIYRAIDMLIVIAIAAFLRFYLIHTTEFDSDQAILFRMAYDAVHHGLFPVTSNVASIGIPHPPGVIYLYMIPALFSANPVGGAMLVSLFTTIAAGLTYLFTARYFGRKTALIAALLYATATVPLNYARFIWQPNLMPPFVVLYLWVLFRGVHDRRPGWLILALPLLGVLYQTHPTGAFLGVLLVAALFLAPKTVRWYDWGIALLLVALVFLPYLIHIVLSGFADLRALVTMAGRSAQIDGQAFMFYHLFLSPFGNAPSHPNSLMLRLVPVVVWLKVVMPVLVVAGAVLMGYSAWGASRRERVEQVASGRWHALMISWQTFRSDPLRCSMALLLVWQVVPLLLLSRHQVNIHSQYLFILLPGPFIFIGLFLVWLVQRLQLQWPGKKLAVLGVYAFTGLLVMTQLASSTALVLDNSLGNHYDNAFRPYHNSAYSIQQALAETERVAEEQGIERIYITSDKATHHALHFLVPQMKRPATVFGTIKLELQQCFVLPDPAAGPAILLTNPYNPLTDVILQQFAETKLVAELPRIAGDPYKLYIVSPKTYTVPQQETFTGNLSLLSARTEMLLADKQSWLVSRWQMQRSEQPAFRTEYAYKLTASTGTESSENMCQMNRLQAGDQLVVAWMHEPSNSDGDEVSVQGELMTTTPLFPEYGPLRADMFRSKNVSERLIATGEHKDSVMLKPAR